MLFWCSIVAFEQVNVLAVKLETTHKPSKPPTNLPQTSQTTHKPAKTR